MSEIKVFKKPPMIYTRDMEWAKQVVSQPGLIYVLPEDAVLVDMDDQPNPIPACVCGGAIEKAFNLWDVGKFSRDISKKYEEFYAKNKRYPTCAEFDALMAIVGQRE